jgi:hypothetical protein
MRNFFVILAAMAAAAAAPASVGAADWQSLFPRQFGNWVAASSPAKVNSPDQAALLKEAGIRNALTRTYSNGKQEVHVTLEEFGDPTGAYEAYTASFDPDMRPSTVGPLTAIEKGRLVMLIGNILATVDNPQLPSGKDLQNLWNQIHEFADQTPLPPIRAYLPEGFSDGSQRYAQGPVGFDAALNSLQRGEFEKIAPEVGFANGAEAMLANYHRGQDAAVLLLIEYPTPSMAEQQIHHLDTVLPAGTTVSRRASLLSIVLGPSSEAFAKSLHNAVNYETEVTWNEGKHVLTDPPWVVILGRIFLGTAVFLIASAILGLIYGGIRIAAKILWPGKIFDRPKSMEVLQLGLSGKPVDTKDFY